MSRRDTISTRTLNKTLTSRILRKLHSHEGFWFYRALGDFTGKNATSLNDFARMLQVVDIQAIDYHFGRGDFRRWLQFIIGDNYLSTRINRIPNDTRGENLRSYLIKTVNERITELKRI